MKNKKLANILIISSLGVGAYGAYKFKYAKNQQEINNTNRIFIGAIALAVSAIVFEYLGNKSA